MYKDNSFKNSNKQDIYSNNTAGPWSPTNAGSITQRVLFSSVLLRKIGTYFPF